MLVATHRGSFRISDLIGILDSLLLARFCKVLAAKSELGGQQ